MASLFGVTIRVLIVDDDALVRTGLSMMLAGADDLQIVGEAGDGSAVAGLVDEHTPDVVLMDIRMPRMDGLEATELLRARGGAPEIIILTTFDADEHVVRALRAGAGGFLLKDTPPADIINAIRRVVAGEPILSPSVTRRLIAQVTEARRSPAQDILGQLSEREREVVIAIGQGKSNAQISADLYMSVATVKAHVSRLLTKLNLNNRVQVALLAHDAGLV